MLLHRIKAPAWVAWGRLLSTQPELPSFKAALREIYRKVHPDLYQDATAKDTNSRSFQLLQEYLAAAKVGGGIGRTAGVPYRFQFYVAAAEAADPQTADPAAPASAQPASALAAPQQHPQQQQQQQQGGGAVGAPPGLRLVSLTLPPPTRPVPGEELSSAARKAFGRLLLALGLPDSFGGEGEEGGQGAKYLSLRHFLPGAVEAVHQASAQAGGAQHELTMARTALRLGRGVVVSFGEAQVAAAPLQQLALVRQLVAALERVEPERSFRGLRLVLTSSFGIDPAGAVWLDGSDSTEAWVRYLHGVDTAHCRERQALLQQVRAQEAAVARSLGVAMVYTHPQLSLESAYVRCLERLAAAAADRGPVSGGRYSEVPLWVQLGAEGDSDAAAAGGSGGTEAAECEVDEATPQLLVPVDVSGAELYSALERLGGRVLAAQQRAGEEEQQLAVLRTLVERKLRLRKLMRNSAVTPAQFRSACSRMMAYDRQLSGLLGGQAVRIAEINSLPPDRSCINIAWNWHL